MEPFGRRTLVMGATGVLMAAAGAAGSAVAEPARGGAPLAPTIGNAAEPGRLPDPYATAERCAGYSRAALDYVRAAADTGDSRHLERASALLRLACAGS